MNAAERQLIEAKVAREAAHAALAARVDSLREHTGDKPLGSRVAHDVVTRARETADETAQVAQESRWVIGGTATLIAAWFARRPLLRGLRKLWDARPGREPPSLRRRLREWTARKAKL